MIGLAHGRCGSCSCTAAVLDGNTFFGGLSVIKTSLRRIKLQQVMGCSWVKKEVRGLDWQLICDFKRDAKVFVKTRMMDVKKWVLAGNDCCQDFVCCTS